MLKDRILSTLRFFDLQDMPLTLSELCNYLIAPSATLSGILNTDWEVVKANGSIEKESVGMGEVLQSLEQDCREEVESRLGFYFLKGRQDLVQKKLDNYLYGVKREKRIKKFSGILRHIPFVRGAALGGSQAFGLQKPTSDIDLFIVTDKNFMWLARTLVTAYFQLFGVRRHGKYVTDRFCLNHYVRGAKELADFRNLYTAMEYARHRPLVYSQAIAQFHMHNSWWMRSLFPNLKLDIFEAEPQSAVQKFLEKILAGKFGSRLEKYLKKLGESRIRRQQFIIVEDDELSFHPDSKQQGLLAQFFEIQ